MQFHADGGLTEPISLQGSISAIMIRVCELVTSWDISA